MNVRARISEQELRELYFEKKMTQEEIAAHFGCGTTTIKRRMIELGIDIRPRGPQPTTLLDYANTLKWSPGLAYAVGIIATDGNLSSDGRHLTITSADKDMLETIKECLGIENSLGETRRWLNTYYRLQWGSVVFYNWLVQIGLTPAKSLTLGALQVPDTFFADFVRGVIDGDGSIVMYQDRWNTFKSEKYVYERVFTTIASASFPFLEWIQVKTLQLIGAKGALIRQKQRLGRAPMWELKFAKKESLVLFHWMYYDTDLPALSRKKALAMRALELENS